MWTNITQFSVVVVLEFNLSPHPSSLLLQRQARHYNDTSLLPSASIIQALAYCFTSFFGARRRVIAKWLNTKCPNGWNCVKTWWWCIPEQCLHTHTAARQHLAHPVIFQNTPSQIFSTTKYFFCFVVVLNIWVCHSSSSQPIFLAKSLESLK